MNVLIKPRTATLVPTMEQRLARCATPMSKFTLFTALASRDGRININNIICNLSTVQREDGSGSSFNLSVYGPDNKVYRSYVRTTD